jgi:serine/threonine protein kinase
MSTIETEQRSAPKHALIGGRFRIEGELGKGGMGAVYRVRDERTGRVLALKQLRTDRESGQSLLAGTHFEREYHTLRQLAHPSIIEVYDYGVEGEAAFYTMELLDGQDVRARGRHLWRNACAILRDVASSLAVIHARRLLHRDISTRNIRCTSDGRAKLIDFGAMSPMGVVKSVVGTPPFVATESMQLQMLDGRADLYALGAVAYWMLTGRHAYPARNFSQLPDLWRTPPAPLRAYNEEVPESLEKLVLELVQLERSARPASAAEVMERLSGIAGLSPRELPEVTRSYLVMPMLVGRDEPLGEVRLKLVSAISHGRGSSVLIEGEQGTGRSRLLDACVLEATHHGAVVNRADSGHGASDDFGVGTALCQQLLSDREDAVSALYPPLLQLEVDARADRGRGGGCRAPSLAASGSARCASGSGRLQRRHGRAGGVQPLRRRAARALHAR